MALRGDDEIDFLLDMMGSGRGQAPTTSSSPTSPSTTHPPDDQQLQLRKEKKKSKKRKKKLRGDKTRVAGKSDDGKKQKKKSKLNINDDQAASSYADTRLSQNCFEWPISNGGQRHLYLGPGLLHSCKGHACDGSNAQQQNYGSRFCQTCGKSAATHELCLSDSAVNAFPPSLILMAHIIIASRNARCLIGEYYPTSTIGQKAHARTDILPPLNSTSIDHIKISNNLDSFVGRILGYTRKLQSSDSSKISANDVQLIQEKVSALINSAQRYKDAMVTTCSYENAARNNDAAIVLVEKRLTTMASCDAVYYRCYYMAIVSYNQTSAGSDIAALIPHPPTYFSCPGLAWDVRAAGIESLRVFLGEFSDNNLDDLAAPLDDSTRQLLLKSWGLRDRLSFASNGAKVSDTADGNRSTNPLLILWQSRFMETIRHVWATRYSAVKSPIALREAISTVNDANKEAHDVHNNSQEALLKNHETCAISLEVAQWRDSIRDYPANFYAYAAPTKEALQDIANCFKSSEVEQILEAGAGSGYWSALLRLYLEKNSKAASSEVPIVVAYDIAPPSNEECNVGAVVKNDYHGNIPTFTEVLQADNLSDASLPPVSSVANTALLLCYPPPGSDMACNALSTYIAGGGRAVMHIGEWQPGLTGSITFEALLTQNFYCRKEDVLHLPSWGTDATYLTIWRKKVSEDEGNAQQGACAMSFSPAIGYCSVHLCSKPALRRCRYARCLQYCSSDCYNEHFLQRNAVLAVQMISSGDTMKYEDDGHFMDLSWISSERQRKKRKKKKRR